MNNLKITNHQPSPDDTALVADSEAKLGTLVNEFGRVCKRSKLKVNVGKSKVRRCSRYGNECRMHVILNGEPLEEVDCLSTWGREWPLMEDVKGKGCGAHTFAVVWDVVVCAPSHTVVVLNGGHRASGALKSALGNRGLGINGNKCLYEGVICTLYGVLGYEKC